jgi:hypothetical protein
MSRRNELSLFAVRSARGGLQLITEDGTVVVEAASWRELRSQLARALPEGANRPTRIEILVGRPGPRAPLDPQAVAAAGLVPGTIALLPEPPPLSA